MNTKIYQTISESNNVSDIEELIDSSVKKQTNEFYKKTKQIKNWRSSNLRHLIEDENLEII